MKHAAAPEPVRAFAGAPPAWLEIRPADTEAEVAAALTMRDLDAGEIAAISLAAQDSDSLLLMDEAAGRAEAARRGIRTTGTLGILRDAANAGFLNLSQAFEQLRGTSFRLPEAAVAELLAQDRIRRIKGEPHEARREHPDSGGHARP